MKTFVELIDLSPGCATGICVRLSGFIALIVWGVSLSP